VAVSLDAWKAQQTLAHVSTPSGIAERIGREVSRLRALKGFVAAVVSRRDGLSIHHTMGTPQEGFLLAAVVAALAGASDSAEAELGRGDLSHAIISYREGTLVVAGAGPDAIVACLVEPDSNVGYAIMAIQDVGRNVMRVLEDL